MPRTKKPKPKFDLIIVEKVYHRFTSDQLTAKLRKLIRKDPKADEYETTSAIEDWFCSLNNPFNKAAYAEVSDRIITIEPSK